MNPKPHPISIFSTLSTVTTLICLAIGIHSPIFLGLACVPYGCRIWRFRSQHFEISPTNIKTSAGVVWKNRTSMPVKNVVEVLTSQSIPGRIFNWGTVTILTAGKSSMQWTQMKDVNEIADAIANLTTP